MQHLATSPTLWPSLKDIDEADGAEIPKMCCPSQFVPRLSLFPVSVCSPSFQSQNTQTAILT